MNRTVTLSLTPDRYHTLPASAFSNAGEKDISGPALKKARIRSAPHLRCTILKKSIDARKKNDIRIVLNVLISDETDSGPRKTFSSVTASGLPRPVVIGYGPAGMFAALALARAGLNPIVLERGRAVTARIRDVQSFIDKGTLLPHSNIQFGEGGAGTFSDGKLYSGISDGRRTFVLQTLVNAGAPSDILYLARPHVGTDHLRTCVKTIREEITSLGGEIFFERTVDTFRVEHGILRGVSHVSSPDGNDRTDLDTELVICAIGNSARDTWSHLIKAGITLTPKPFSVGVRIEHPQSLINLAQYGPFHSHPALPPAEYKLVAKTSTGRSLYTFCMCPGGYVVAGASGPGQVVTNGMSNYTRNAENANSALLVGVNQQDFESDDVLAGVRFQEQLEHKAFLAGGNNYNAPAQSVGHFLKKLLSPVPENVRPSYRPGVSFTDLHTVLPDFVSETLREGLLIMNRKIHGFSHYDAVLTGVETRSSAPIRIPREDTLSSVAAEGLYPCGEGAGYAGGIMSSAIDGLRCAEAILKKFDVAPLYQH